MSARLVKGVAALHDRGAVWVFVDTHAAPTPDPGRLLGIGFGRSRSPPTSAVLPSDRATLVPKPLGLLMLAYDSHRDTEPPDL